MGLPLITLAEYKAYEGITNPNQDTEITAIIPKVSELVKNYCRRSFIDYIDETKVELFTGGDVLYLKEFPVASISSIEVSTDYGKTYSSLVEYTDWALDKINDAIVPLNTLKTFPELVNGYRISYTGGFETIPEDLKLAVMDLLTYYMKNDGAIHSPKAPGSNNVQIEYISTTNLPAHIKRVLDLYVADYT